MSDENKTEKQGGVAVEERVVTKKPSQYKVVLLNDDYTPMDFVIHVLTTIFQKDETTAHQIMLQVHNEGKGIAGVYSFDIAETKVVLVTSLARKHQHPLKCILEKDT